MTTWLALSASWMSRRYGSSSGSAGMPVARKNVSRMTTKHEQDQASLDEAEDAADGLVDETRLLEQRLRLVEPLGQDREDDAAKDEDRQEPDHLAVLRRELGPVVAEEVAERRGQVGREQEREQDRADPDQAADRALGEARG